MVDYRRSAYRTFFESSLTKINRENLKEVFYDTINFLNIPHPDTELTKYFIHPNIIELLLSGVLNQEYVSVEDRKEFFAYLGKAIKKLKTTKSPYFVSFRILHPSGYYPNIPVSRGNCHYTIQNQLPIIWTKNTRSYDENIVDLSITNWLTRNELKLATAIMCAPGGGTVFHLTFTRYNSINLSWDCLSNVPNELKPYFLREYFDLNSRFQPLGINQWNRRPLHDVSLYRFSTFEEYSTWFNKIFDKFSIQNDLLLRTCNYFVKSQMHWDNGINEEEAILNLLFCYEGCLHLIQQKYGEYGPKLNFKLLERVFEENIEKGGDILNWVRGTNELRIILVHPESRWGAEWKPFVTSEDFYENFKIARSLLNFILIDKYRELGTE